MTSRRIVPIVLTLAFAATVPVSRASAARWKDRKDRIKTTTLYRVFQKVRFSRGRTAAPERPQPAQKRGTLRGLVDRMVPPLTPEQLAKNPPVRRAWATRVALAVEGGALIAGGLLTAAKGHPAAGWALVGSGASLLVSTLTSGMTWRDKADFVASSGRGMLIDAHINAGLVGAGVGLWNLKEGIGFPALFFAAISHFLKLSEEQGPYNNPNLSQFSRKQPFEPHTVPANGKVYELGGTAPWTEAASESR